MDKPEIYGRYLLIELISVGGMAEVFKAMTVGVSGFQKVLAIKKVLPNVAEDQAFVKMFVDEGNIAGQLHHTNIAQIYDLGAIGDSYFIAMEFVAGQDLRAIFDKVKKTRTPIPVDMAALIASQALSGLDYAHRKSDATQMPMNIVHRDVSPPNILISYEGEVKLVDFGIAKAAKKISQTQAGVLKGKFGYMSPEQVRGMQVDQRSDIFAIGIVFWEMLAHRRLFVGETDFATLEKVRGMEIQTPSNMHKDVPEELDRIVMRALERDVKKRYGTAEEMQQDLQRYLYSNSPVFTQRDLSNWVKQTFAGEMQRSLRRMTELENIDLEALGIDIASIDEASVRSLRKDVLAAGEEKTSIAPTIPVHEDPGGSGGEKKHKDNANRERSKDKRDQEDQKQQAVQADPPPVKTARKPQVTISPEEKSASPKGANAWLTSINGIVTILSILLVCCLALGFFLISGTKQNVISVNNDGSAGVANFIANHPEVSVKVNNQKICNTPCRVKDFWPGQHHVSFEKAGFLPQKVSFEVKEGKKTSVSALLFREGEVPAVLMVRSNPPGADVWINDRRNETRTPMAVNNLKAGVTYSLRVSMNDFHEQQRDIRLGMNQYLLAEFTMAPLTPSIRIHSDPPGAKIFLDGEDTEKLTPNRISDLEEVLKYKLRLELEGYKTLRMNVSAGEDRETFLDLELEPLLRAAAEEDNLRGRNLNYGWLTVFTDPATRIFIDGRSTGRYAPAKNIRLAKGKHEIRLVNEVYGIDHSAPVQVKGGQTQRFNKKF